MTKKRKKRAVPKKVRAWYRTYRSQMLEHDMQPWSLKIWAVVESERYEGTPKGKELNRFLGPQEETEE